MKWIVRLSLALAILLAGLIAVACMTAVRGERPVGFQVARAVDTEGQPFIVGIWYPTRSHGWPTTLLGPLLMNVAQNGSIDGHDLPLVVISHGNGGGPGSHADLALVLASAGYVVAAPMHNGDNYADQSAAGSASLFSGRNRQFRAALDYMLGNWPGQDRIDHSRVGAFGFSAGAFTVLTVAGAQPDLRLVARHCAQSHEFYCDVLRRVNSRLLEADGPNAGGAFLSDARIRAAVVVAPGMAFAIGPDGFAKVRMPIQLWSGDRDVNVPYATNTSLVRDGLGPQVEFHSIPGAGHLSFLAPCGVLRPPGICSDPDHFDRKAAHATMNAEVLRFFDRNLMSHRAFGDATGR